ncbi:hypothetical protein BKA70DRAFT_1263682 [Coprinopsis sp. MPI-PUGE-AT-0042]|nr:hypothetical protein BKA70DRAFT_1263682 [Coprinopsis sp. MPI-PUGE-AT-0042]
MLPDPRLIPYISSNNPFPSSLGGPLRAYLGSLDEKIREFDIRISRLEGEIQRFKIELQGNQKERNRLANERHQYQHVTAAVRRLPPEVVALILQFALTSRHGAAGGDGRALEKHGRKYFAGLRSVCRLWRATAMTTPDFWRHLHVAPEDRFRFGMSRSELASRLKGWFSKGGTNAELTLLISGWGKSHHDDIDMLACLDQPGLNFNTISLGSEKDNIDDVIPLLQPMDGFKCTRNVSLSWGFFSRTQVKRVWTTSGIFPRLESLTLHAVVALPALVPQQPLICLHLDNSPFYKLYELARLLPSLPCLQELILRFDKLTKEEEVLKYLEEKLFRLEKPSSPASHPSLKRLVATCALPIRMFETFTFPSLEFFRVVGPMRHIDGMFDHLRDFLMRSNGRNLTLDLSAAFVHHAELDSIFACVPNLRALYLDDPQDLLASSTEEYWPSRAHPPTRIDNIVFTSCRFRESSVFDKWSQNLASRFTKNIHGLAQAKTMVYFRGAHGTADVVMGSLHFSAVGEQSIYEMTESRFPLRNHDDYGMCYSLQKTKRGTAGNANVDHGGIVIDGALDHN